MTLRQIYSGPVLLLLAGALLIAQAAFSQSLKWTAKASTPVTGGTGRNGAMCFTLNNKIYLGGGYIASNTCTNSFFEYDTMTNAWTQKADLPVSNRSAGVAFSAGGKAYVGLGLKDYFTGTSALLNDLWEYNPTANTWTAKASLPDTGRGTFGYFVVNNKVYVVGGQVTISDSLTASVWEYDPATDTWTAKAPFPGGKVSNPFAFSIGTKGYISCGYANHSLSKKTYEFDPVANTWTSKADFPGSPGAAGVSFVLNNKGYCGLGISDTFYAYNPVTNTWSSALTNFPASSRGYGVATQIGTKAYLGGGWKFNTSTSSETFYQDWYQVYDSSVKLGTTELLSKKTLQLYPNPAKGIVYISLSDQTITACEVAIFNDLGEIVYTGKWVNNVPIDISALPEGQYFLRLKTGEGAMYSSLTIGG